MQTAVSSLVEPEEYKWSSWLAKENYSTMDSSVWQGSGETESVPGWVLGLNIEEL